MILSCTKGKIHFAVNNIMMVQQNPNTTQNQMYKFIELTKDSTRHLIDRELP